MPTPPLLTATPSGDVLELRPGGSWTAAYVTTLEALTGAVTARLDHSKAVKVDMAEVRELDTLGAWLLEKMSRNIGRASRRNRRRGRQLCRPHRGGPSGQSPQSRSGPGAKSCRRQGGRNRAAAVSSTEDKKSLRVVIHCLPRCRGKTSPRGRSIEAPACSSFLARVHCQAASERAVFVAGIAAGAMET